MRLLLLGRTGQLGWELRRTIVPLGQVVALDVPELSFTDLDQLRRQVIDAQPQVIINAVAYTAVDEAEKHPELTMEINGHSPGFLASIAKEIGAVFLHYSTDYVFDGAKNAPYTEDDTPNPLGVYAAAKLAGDQAIQAVDDAFLIFRSAWIYSQRRDNFIKKVLSWAHAHVEVSVVTDQVGCPTCARDLAEATAQVLAQGGQDIRGWVKERRGVYNLAGSGYTSRYDWAAEIIKLDPHPESQAIRTLKPALTKDFPTPARRPLYTPLDCSRFSNTFGLCLPDWRESLALAMQDA